jgi:RNA recognition motif-containing protein
MGKELYIGSISARATETDIRKLFSVVGEVGSIHLITDVQTGEFKGCGYVKMTTDEDAREAIDTLDGALLVDRVISVSVARPQKPKGSTPRGGQGRQARDPNSRRGRK